MKNSPNNCLVEELCKFIMTLDSVDPYGLLNFEYLENVLQRSVAAKFDWSHQRSELSAIIELFQEYYRSAEWSTILKIPEETECGLHDASSILFSLNLKFGRHNMAAQERLASILKVFMAAPDKVQENVFGCSLDVNPEERDEWLEELNEGINRAPYHANPDENYCTFLELVKK